MRLKSKQDKVITICVVVIGFAVSAFLCRPVFYLNDDVTMRSILSGSYSGVPDGHAVYMKYPLTWILSLLYRLTDKVHWMEVFFAGCLALSGGEVVYAISGEKKGNIWRGIPVFLFVLPFFIYMHYTVVAAVLAGTAAFLFCAGNKRIKPVAFWLLSWMIRSQVAYLAIPFMGIALLWEIVSAGKGERGLKTAVLAKTAGIAVSGLLLCAGINYIAYGTEEWKEYLEYNDVRTELFDYTNFHSTDYYEECYEQYGMTEKMFRVLDSYNTILDSSITKENIKNVADKVSAGMVQERDNTAWIKDCVRQYYYQIRYGDNPYVFLWCGAFTVLLLLLFAVKNWWGVFLMICLGGGRSVIWIYLIYRGRFPERISISLYVIEILLMLGMLWSLPSECQERFNGINCKLSARWKGAAHIYKSIQLLLFLGVACLLAGQVKNEVLRAREKAETQREWNVLKEYCENNPKTLYLLDVFSSVEYGGFQYEKDCSNLMLAGGWMSANPLAVRRLNDIGAADGGQALYENSQTAFLAEQDRDVEWLENCLSERFGECSLVPVSLITCSEEKVFIEYHIVK